AGLDPTQIRESRKLIRELGEAHTILLSTHILPEVEMTCDRVIIIHRGRVAASGGLRELEQEFSDRMIVETAEPVTNLAPVRDISGVTNVECEPLGSGSRLRVTGLVDDLGPRLCALSVVQGWKIKEVRPDRQNLEDLFVRITERGD